MAIENLSTANPQQKAATSATIVLAFASVYFFWVQPTPPFAFWQRQCPRCYSQECDSPSPEPSFWPGAAGVACVSRGRRATWPSSAWWDCCCSGRQCGPRLRRGTVSSGLASLVFAVSPLYVALIEMALPGGEPLPRAAGWACCSLCRPGGPGLAIAEHWAGRQSRPPLGSRRLARRGALLDRWEHRLPPRQAQGKQLRRRFLADAGGRHLLHRPRHRRRTMAAGPSQRRGRRRACLPGHRRLPARLYRLHLPARTRAVAKVMSYTYVNPVVAVLLGIFCSTSGQWLRSSPAWLPSCWPSSCSPPRKCKPDRAAAGRRRRQIPQK